jgi:hypothetical protein
MEVFWLGTAAMKAASVLLEPFGATINTLRPALISGQGFRHTPSNRCGRAADVSGLQTRDGTGTNLARQRRL